MLTFALSISRQLGSFVPDAGQIAFHSTHGMAQDIYLYDMFSAKLLNLTRTRTIDERTPAWSPDGAQLIYVARGNANRSDELFVRTLRTGITRQITEDGMNSYMPSWSPDGTRIAFVIAYNRIITLQLETLTQSQVLTRGFAPHWSPDSANITFTATDISGGAYLGAITAEGEDSRFLTVGAVNYMDGNWSPNQQQMVVTGSRERALDLYLLDAACLPACQDTAQRLTDNPGSDYAPEWSSDGRSIVYTCGSVSTPATHICVLNLPANQITILTTELTGAFNDAAAWRPTATNLDK